MRIFRATVRGQFDGLDEEQQAALRARAEEHDILLVSFSREGSFVYSPGLTWFNLRYELRSPDEATDREVEEQALTQAAERLDRMAIPYKRLRVDLMDMASIWQDGPSARARGDGRPAAGGTRIPLAVASPRSGG